MRASPARLARRARSGRAVAEIDRVREAAVEHARAFMALAAAVDALPRPAGATDDEETAFRQSIAALQRDLISLTEMMAEDVARHCGKGRS